MLRFKLFITLIISSGFLFAQGDIEIDQFHSSLNQFLSVRDFCLSKDGNEAFFTIQSPFQEISQIVSVKKVNGEWTEPELLPFSDSYVYMEPFLSKDDKRLYFASDRPLNDSIQEKKDFDIWYVERKSLFDHWSEPINLGKPVNSELNEFYPTLSDNNNLYFTLESPAGLGKDDIYFCRWDNGNYASPVLLDENINSDGYEFNAYISRNEDYLIFSKYNAKGGHGSGDLYISKKDGNGKWEKAENIGLPINTKYMEYCPFYDDKRGILYFTSKRNDIIPQEFQSVSEFQKYVIETNNGLSKIYMTKLKID
ncbi:hypothetical protein LCM02_02880 [Lutimonas saemankumensis]|uniref:TolB family protein n=1 Tax=Lutimonas saemankumensis TaxID=483016 RepID=UPI001CD576A2|nr:hypothetical protein [Lutimonas saemankumensis]MCA0931381.1 hypothetical protein [Lutimonas saemankumensis]